MLDMLVWVKLLMFSVYIQDVSPLLVFPGSSVHMPFGLLAICKYCAVVHPLVAL